jgi:hypothetical protein
VHRWERESSKQATIFLTWARNTSLPRCPAQSPKGRAANFDTINEIFWWGLGGTLAMRRVEEKALWSADSPLVQPRACKMTQGRWHLGGSQVLQHANQEISTEPSFMSPFKASPSPAPSSLNLDKEGAASRPRLGQTSNFPILEAPPWRAVSRAAERPLPFNSWRDSGPHAGPRVPAPPAGVRPLASAVWPLARTVWPPASAVWPLEALAGRFPSQPPHCPIPGQSRGMREDQGDSREKFSDAGHAAPAGPGAVGTPPPSKAQVPSGAAGPLTHSFLCTPQGWAAVGAGDSAVRHLHSQAGNHHRWLWGRTALGPQQPGPGRSGQEPRGTGRGGAGPKEPPLRLGTLSRGRATLSRPSRCPGWPATDWRNSYLPRSSPVARSGRQPISSLLAHAPVSPFSPLPSNTVTFQPSPSIPQFRGTYLFIYLFSYLFILLSL